MDTRVSLIVWLFVVSILWLFCQTFWELWSYINLFTKASGTDLKTHLNNHETWSFWKITRTNTIISLLQKYSCFIVCFFLRKAHVHWTEIELLCHLEPQAMAKLRSHVDDRRTRRASTRDAAGKVLTFLMSCRWEAWSSKVCTSPASHGFSMTFWVWISYRELNPLNWTSFLQAAIR